jgi:hypothetical protein
MIGIRDLVVFEKLKVHEILVEPRRVRATYSLFSGDDQCENKELIYSYSDRLFDPDRWEDVNLASMMLAQVALNYGLFFKTIEFDGLYDETDRSFLKNMIENTSREILVNKIMRPNEFLKPPFDQVRFETLERYTAAELVFENSDYGHLNRVDARVETDPDQYAILSSGGKDSLLTYGLISEIGRPHPVFINESGRHWFSAVNAHDYFKQHEPNTAKPWCNSDRIFNWMARQMPFIKDNFQQIRADIYPIRLWTVAIFLFGVLPIARKRGIGNILIGDEYDTTVKGNFHGISHYNALYDQSRYFDNAMTRYYRRKGWGILQYSVVRSLSELLILKILVGRYPELQAQQVSCHAAHEKDGRMLPCGNCEKCRRIIGMLKALGEDPGRCGYTPEQVEKGLAALSRKGVKQLGTDASHLYHLLLSKGLIPENEHTRRLARPHAFIEKLRFDSERSQVADLPKHIRRPLFEILAEGAEGAVMLKDRKWIDLEIDEAFLSAPHFLSATEEATPNGSHGENKNRKKKKT